MREPNRRPEPGSGMDQLILFLFGGGVILAVMGLYWCLQATSTAEGINAEVRDNPFKTLFALGSGTLVWPTSATRILVSAVAVLIGVVVAIVLLRRQVRRSSKRLSVDAKARSMGQGRDLDAYCDPKTLAQKARELGSDWTGVVVGKTVVGNRLFLSGLEECSVDIWGPRSGKTTSRCIPAIVDAPGAVLATSNKRDLVDATRDLRSEKGTVWVFDPQQIAQEECTWWWNPLNMIVPPRDAPNYAEAVASADIRAAKLAGHFATGARTDGDRGDAYFEPSGEVLIAALLLAAALEQRPITDCYQWSTQGSIPEVVDALRRHGQITAAHTLAGFDNAAPEERSGLFGTARKMLACLRFASTRTWITGAGPYDSRPRLDPHAFVRSTDTLYSLSMEGAGTASPLVTALTAEVAEAAQVYSSTQYRNRLPVPLVCVLDEAANVCLWRDLPNLYSHFGSRGILLMTILQSWSQGVEVWGRSGMQKLWDAASVKVYGGGKADPGFLRDLAELIGDHDRVTRTVNTSAQGRSVSTQLHRERIMEASHLNALPRGRAIVLASGAPSTMVRTIPWTATSHKDAIVASIKAHDPGATKTLAEAGA